MKHNEEFRDGGQISFRDDSFRDKWRPSEIEFVVEKYIITGSGSNKIRNL